MDGLTKRTYLVAGAAGGIGAASARRLAAEGAAVVVGDIDLAGARATAAAIERDGGTALAVEYDQSDETSVAGLITRTVERFGGLDGVHANAADLSDEIFGRDVDLLGMDIAVWERTLRVNLIGYALVIREALPHLLTRGAGAIVCTSTTTGAPPIGGPSPAAYIASKAGVNALVRHVASRWGQEGIRCNAVAPGVVLTDAAKRVMSDAFIEELRTGTRSTRLGEPEDIAATVAFLLSDEAAWVNGQVWNVNGGMAL